MSEGGKRRREDKKAEWKSKAEEDEEERRELLRRRLSLMAWGAEEELRKRETIRMVEEDRMARWRQLAEVAGGAEADPLQWVKVREPPTVLNPGGGGPRGVHKYSSPSPQFWPSPSPLSGARILSETDF